MPESWRTVLTACALGLCVPPGSAHAGELAITLGELDRAIATLDAQPDALERLVLERIEQQLDTAGFGFDGGTLVYSDTLSNRTVEDGCNRTEVLRLTTDVRLAGSSSLKLSLESLHDPITLTLKLDAALDAEGRGRQTFGFRFRGCRVLGRDTFDVSARGPVSLAVDITFELNPEWRGDQRLVLRPHIAVDGALLERDIRVDVDDSIVRRVFEELLEREIEDAFGAERIAEELSELETHLFETLGLADTGGLIELKLPPPTDEQIIKLYELLSPDAQFSLTIDQLLRHRYEFLAALILGDGDQLQDLISDAVACEAGELLQVDLPHRPVYTLADGSCDTAIPADTGAYFSDAACQRVLPVTRTALGDFCATVLDSDRLGNAANDIETLDHWSLSPGSRFDIAALPIGGLEQPWVRREAYRRIETDRGLCELEMRIYSTQPQRATGSARPLLALHGGTWQYRESGFLGIEAMATHFSNAGFVVFAPFYRLIGDREGNAACNAATMPALKEDVSAALDWVMVNAARFGANGTPSVFGQSAGGHLATALAINRPTDLASVVLFYAPVDFRDFAAEMQAGRYTGARGRRVLERISGTTLDALSLDIPLLVENSFPTRIATAPGRYPPMFLLHGEADELLPFRQSVRLCNALSGNVDDGPAPLSAATEGYRRVVSCDTRGSELHLLSEGDHALDVCIAEGLCLSGSPEAVPVTADSISRMIDWLVIYSNQPEKEHHDEESGSRLLIVARGSGAAGLPLTVCLLLAALLRLRLAQRDRRR